MCTFSRELIFVDFVVAWLSVKFSSSTVKQLLGLTLCFLLGNLSEIQVILKNLTTEIC